MTAARCRLDDGPIAGRTASARAAVIAAVLWAAGGGAASANQAEPHVERGFKPGSAYDFSGIDSINLFNGNLVLNVPIGPRYPVGPGLSYQLRLVYNSKVWDYFWQETCVITQHTPFMGLNTGEIDCHAYAGPAAMSEAGMGWRLSLGELVEPGLPPPLKSREWRYFAPDGGQHRFLGSLHGLTGQHASPDPLCGEIDSSPCYTNDGSYLRMQEVGDGVRKVEFPDGTVHTFERPAGGGGRWPLTRIEDPFGNWVSAAYVADPADGIDNQVIADSTGRSHTIDFGPSPDFYLINGTGPQHPVYAHRVESVTLETVGGTTELDFSYGSPPAGETLRPACPETEGGVVQRDHYLYLLGSVSQEVEHPTNPSLNETLTHEFKYYTMQDDIDAGYSVDKCSATAGRIRSVKLPTGGTIEWEYGGYAAPVIDCNGGIHTPPPGPGPPDPSLSFSNHTGLTYGVTKRTRWDRDLSTKLGERTYSQVLEPLEGPFPACGPFGGLAFGDVRTVVQEGIGQGMVSRTDHYYSVWGSLDDGDWKGTEWGLNLTHRFEPFQHGGEDYFLASRTYKCEEGNDLRTLEGCKAPNDDPQLDGDYPWRSVYKRYSHSGNCTAWDSGPCDYTNPEEGTVVIYHDDADFSDDRFAVTEVSDFDGFGHFRTTRTDGNFNPSFDGSNVVVSHTAYTDRGDYEWNNPASSSLQLPEPGHRWLLTTYGETTVHEDGKGTARTRYCFSEDGFLLGKRIYASTAATAQARANDVVIRYAEGTAAGELGFPVEERTYGGDLHGNPPPICGSIPGAGSEEYRIRREYANGVLARSWFVDGAGGELLEITDVETDPSTGLVTAATDPAGLRTTYAYDSALRLTRIDPPGHDAATTIGYDTSAGSVTTRRAKAGIEYAKNVYGYDGLGQWVETSRTMPEGAVAVRKTRYRPTGWKERETAFQRDDASEWTVYRGYDPFGRPGEIDPPGPFSTLLYHGAEKNVQRKVSVQTPGGLQETASFEGYNRQGRLVRVTQPLPDGGGIEARYSYDVLGNLEEVRLMRVPPGPGGSPVLVQERDFHYDGRGVLLSETQPELGPDGGGTITYDGYDSRGNVLGKRHGDGTGGWGPFDLGYRYDRAGRLTQVLHRGRPLKEYFYARSNQGSDLRAGKLVQTKRRNDLTADNGAVGAATDKVVVTETYSYDDPGGTGRLAGRRVRSSDGRLFDVAFRYDPLGNLVELTYPTCRYPAGCAAVSRDRELRYEYDHGYLTQIRAQLDGTFPMDEIVKAIHYHPNGLWERITHATPGGNVAVTDHQVLWLGLQQPISGGIYTEKGGTPLMDLTPIEYDGARNVTRTGGDRFYYDTVMRLVEAELSLAGGGTAGRSYTYDAAGNLLTMGPRVFTVDSATNRLTGPEDVAYDEAGNLVRSSGLADRTFDPFSRLTGETGPGVQRGMLYNADGERLAVRDWMRQNEAWTLRGLGNEVLRRIERDWGGGGETWTWANDHVFRGASPVAEVVDNAGGDLVRHYHLDHLGSLRLKTDPHGQPYPQGSPAGEQRRYKHWPYGERLEGPTDNEDRLRFTGHERDFNCADPANGGCESGGRDDLDYMHARYYSPWHGRFLSVDVVEGDAMQPLSWNRYAYARARPLNLVDPDGLWGRDFHQDITYLLARAAGLGPRRADEIGYQTQKVDMDFRNPFIGVIHGVGLASLGIDYAPNRIWHFASDATLGAQWSALQRNPGNDHMLGAFLHVLQDSYSHSGIWHSLGFHISKWTDSTKRHAQSAMAAAEATHWAIIAATGSTTALDFADFRSLLWDVLVKKAYSDEWWEAYNRLRERINALLAERETDPEAQSQSQ